MSRVVSAIDATSDDCIARTTAGRWRGVRSDGVTAFRGIEYGRPAVGERRFKPPQPPEPWSGVRDAFEFGPVAPQSDHAFGLAPEVAALFSPKPLQRMGEDCLVLNLWTPALRDGAGRPVMVWLHGGAFIAGSGAAPWTAGDNLARHRDVVVITVNHRLGALGYLHLEDLAGEAFAGSSVAGMLDIVAVLTWVRDNIAEFGGDPRNVTIFGESGGGAKVGVLMAMPAAQGLFHKAIIQSGPGVSMADRADGTRAAELFLRELGLTPARAATLYRLPLEQLLNAQQRVVEAAQREKFSERRRHGFNPVQGQPDFPAGPFEPSAPEISREVPLLIGTNRHEMALFYGLEPWLANLDEAGLVQRLRPMVDDRAAGLVARYRRQWPRVAPADLFIAIAGDVGMNLPSVSIADRKAEQRGAPVFSYLFTREATAFGGRLGSAHIVEIPHVFDQVATAPFLDQSPDSNRLAATVSTAWAEFARTGVPSAPELPEWPPYDPIERSTMVLDVRSHVAENPFGKELEIWAQEARAA